MLEHRHIFVNPRYLYFLIWKRNSVQSAIQFCDIASHRKICQRNSFFFPVYGNGWDWVYSFSSISLEFVTKRSVRQNRSLLMYFFSYVIKMIVEIALLFCENSSSYICADDKLWFRSCCQCFASEWRSSSVVDISFSDSFVVYGPFCSFEM